MRVVWRIIRWAIVLFFGSTILVTLLYRYVPVVVTPLMVIRCVQQVVHGEAPRCHHVWTALDDISPSLPIAVIASEDQQFMYHHGFDFAAISKARERNKTSERLYGASTISQQTAKNVFLWPSRTWLRKGLEAYFTVLIELLWGKERIMEVYLNSIEMGDGIYGVRAAATNLFRKTPIELTRGDCALLAATLPNPRQYDAMHPTPYLVRRQRAILSEMRHIATFPTKKE